MNDDLRPLADRYLDDTLDDEQLRRLEGILECDPESKRQFIAHCVLHAQLGLIADELCANEPQHRLVVSTSDRSASWLPIGGLAIAASLLAVVLTSFPLKQTTQQSGELEYEWESIPIRTVGYAFPEGRSGQAIAVVAGSSGAADTTTQMTAAGGVNVSVSAGSRFGFASDTKGLLYSGSVLVAAKEANGQFAVELGDKRILSHGARFELNRLSTDVAYVDAVSGQVEIQTRIAGPRLRWSFDDVEHDSLPISLRGQSTRCDGLVGSGAIRFHDERGTCANIIGGTESTVGSGVFATSGGITIEAIIVSHWNAVEKNSDVIFRKEDGPNRILFALQNNETIFEIPEVAPGPVLSFGIFLEQFGYSELDMPLDGQDGRPRLDQIVDGKPHHIAATYDSFTGIKAISVDGRICFSHYFPAGHCVQSGGPKEAMIGGWGNREAFAGVIDELAIYDYALSSEQIAKHHELAAQGAPWLPARSGQDQRWTTITTVQPGQRYYFGEEQAVSLSIAKRTQSKDRL